LKEGTLIRLIFEKSVLQIYKVYIVLGTKFFK
jgi:hypothetical protein